jgi:hypothetical protein
VSSQKRYLDIIEKPLSIISLNFLQLTKRNKIVFLTGCMENNRENNANNLQPNQVILSLTTELIYSQYVLNYLKQNVDYDSIINAPQYADLADEARREVIDSGKYNNILYNLNPLESTIEKLKTDLALVNNSIQERKEIQETLQKNRQKVQLEYQEKFFRKIEILIYTSSYKNNSNEIIITNPQTTETLHILKKTNKEIDETTNKIRINNTIIIAHARPHPELEEYLQLIKYTYSLKTNAIDKEVQEYSAQKLNAFTNLPTESTITDIVKNADLEEIKKILKEFKINIR